MPSKRPKQYPTKTLGHSEGYYLLAYNETIVDLHQHENLFLCHVIKNRYRFFTKPVWGYRMTTKICQHCGHIGEPTTQGAGSFFVDVMIWMVFISFTLFSAFLPFLLIPLAWTIYHIITYKSITCPKCEDFEMVRLNSRKGKAAMLRFHGHSDVVRHSGLTPHHSNLPPRVAH
jgi:hypothetical protein